VADPFADFFRRYGWQTALLTLLFILLFKIPEQALVGGIMSPFYIDMGFSKTQIGAITKIYGIWIGIVTRWVAVDTRSYRTVMPSWRGVLGGGTTRSSASGWIPMAVRSAPVVSALVETSCTFPVTTARTVTPEGPTAAAEVEASRDPEFAFPNEPVPGRSTTQTPTPVEVTDAENPFAGTPGGGLT
jgi:hypothetical protein